MLRRISSAVRYDSHRKRSQGVTRVRYVRSRVFSSETAERRMLSGVSVASRSSTSPEVGAPSSSLTLWRASSSLARERSRSFWIVTSTDWTDVFWATFL